MSPSASAGRLTLCPAPNAVPGDVTPVTCSKPAATEKAIATFVASSLSWKSDEGGAEAGRHGHTEEPRWMHDKEGFSENHACQRLNKTRHNRFSQAMPSSMERWCVCSTA